MPSPTYYNTGTASVANGATAIAFEGALLGTADAPNFIAGDLFCDPAQPLVPPQRIASVDYDAGTAALAVGWPGTTMTDAAYEVRYVGDTVRSTAQTRRLLEQLSVVQANGRGLFYRFSSLIGDVELDPGYLALNNADPAAATLAALSNTDANGAPVSAEIDTWDDADSTVRGKLWVRSVSRPAVFRSYAVTGTVVTATGRRKLTLVHVGGGGSFAEDEELMAFFVPNGNKGDSFQYDVAVANPAARAAYDGEAEGFVVLELDNGATPSRTVFWRMGAGGSGDWELVAYLTGEAGVTPRGAWLTATVYALNDLVTFGGNAYVCTEAHSSGDFATDLAASKWVLFVAQGAKGWSPQLVAEADGARRVIKLAGYVGGAGTAPTNNVGEYLKDDGTFTANIAEAADFRGASGAPGLDGASQFVRMDFVVTSNIDLSTALANGATAIDGVTPATGKAALLTGQTNAAENGPYICPAAGAASRHASFATFDSLPGVYFSVMRGTANADTLWRCTSDQGGAIGTDPLVFTQFGSFSGEVESTDGGATAGPALSLYRNSASPAAADVMGRLDFNGKDAGGNKTLYASVKAILDDPTDGSEDASLQLEALVGGAMTGHVLLGGGVVSLPLGQLKFPATQVPSADANTLDHYDEGTYTPAYNGTVGNGTLSGSYTKVGRVVVARFRLDFGGTTTANAGGISCGLPFNCGVTYQALVYALDSGTAHRLGIARITSDGGSTVQFSSDNSGSIWVNNVPFTWATGDILAFTMTYTV